MRELMDALKNSLRWYPRLYGALRASRDGWLRLYSPHHQRRYRERVQRIQAIEREVQQIEARHNSNGKAPVLFFNASSHLTNLSFNAAVGLLTTWGLRLAGQPVVYLVCHGGLGKCVQGTSRVDPGAPPPCATCVAHNSLFYPAQHTVAFPPTGNIPGELEAMLGYMTVEDLMAFSYGNLEIGALCVPSARWVLRRHNLDSDAVGRQVLTAFISSSISLVEELERLLKVHRPCALVVFNGTFFPEATARTVAMAHGIPVVTYEIGFCPQSAFFSHGVATDWSIRIPASFQMGAAEDTELDQYLDRRTRGIFTMGGVHFWPEMKSVGPELRRKAEAHRQMVTVFTNVVFDTSQIYANTIFENMFDWLGETMKLAVAHPETLFIVRAHPDELRPGKESQESVEQWLKAQGYLGLPNITFIPPTEYVSSYDLTRLSRFCVVYNSTMGLEATLFGTPVVTGGRTRYSQEAVTHAPASRNEYRSLVWSFLEGDVPPVPRAWQEQARRYMYFSIFRTSLDLSAFVEPLAQYETTIKTFNALALHPDNSQEMHIICDGINKGTPFYNSVNGSA